MQDGTGSPTELTSELQDHTIDLFRRFNYTVYVISNSAAGIFDFICYATDQKLPQRVLVAVGKDARDYLTENRLTREIQIHQDKYNPTDTWFMTREFMQADAFPVLQRAGAMNMTVASTAQFLSAKLDKSLLPGVRSVRDDTKIQIEGVEREPKLQFPHIAREVASVISEWTANAVNSKAATEAGMGYGLSLGIIGPWGSGKSTLLALLEAELRKRHAVVSVNAWKARTETKTEEYIARQILKTLRGLTRWHAYYLVLVRAFFRKFSHEISAVAALAIIALIVIMSLKHFAPSWSPTSAFGAGSIGALLVLGLWSALKPLIQKSVDLLMSRGDTEELSRQGIEESYKDIAPLFAGKRRPDSRLVVLIDDLDRCGGVQIVQFLRSISSLSASGIVVITAYDQDYIAGVMQADHEKTVAKEMAIKDFGYRYLEKIVHIPLYVPSVRPEDVYELGLGKRPRKLDLEEAREPKRKVDLNKLTIGGVSKIPRGLVTAEVEQERQRESVLTEVIGDVLEATISPLRINMRQVKSILNCVKLYSRVLGVTTEKGARTLVAFFIAIRFDRLWLRNLHKGAPDIGTPIATDLKLQEVLRRNLQSDTELLERLSVIAGLR